MAASMALDLAGIVVEDFSVMGKWNEMCNRSLTIFCKCCYKMVVVAATLQSIWFEKKCTYLLDNAPNYLVGCVIQKGFSNSELRGRKVSIAIEVFFSQTNIYVEVDVIGRIPEERSLACFFNRLGHFKMAIGIGHGMELSGLNSKKVQIKEVVLFCQYFLMEQH